MTNNQDEITTRNGNGFTIHYMLLLARVNSIGRDSSEEKLLGELVLGNVEYMNQDLYIVFIYVFIFVKNMNMSLKERKTS